MSSKKIVIIFGIGIIMLTIVLLAITAIQNKLPIQKSSLSPTASPNAVLQKQIRKKTEQEWRPW